MEREFLQLGLWDQMTAAECEEIARTLAKCLPKPWKFDKVRLHEMGGQKRHVAFFTLGTDSSGDTAFTCYSLIPGGETVLGYDRRQPFVPSAKQARNWLKTEKKIGSGLEQYLDQCLTPLRKVQVRPLLVQTRLNFFTFELAQSWPDARAILDFGCRLLTSDEWEYACSAGSRTLFRWGNDCPVNRYPGLLSASQIEAAHNAFGLQIAHSPHDCECVQEPKILRGGDNGRSYSSGLGIFAGWIPLASAFAEPELGGMDGKFRFAFPLDDFVS